MANKKRKLYRSLVKSKQRSHFSRRMEERYGLEVSSKKNREFVGWLKDNKNSFPLTRVVGRGKTIYALNYKGIMIPVVFDRNKKTLVTALGYNMLDKETSERLRVIMYKRNLKKQRYVL